MKKYQRLAQDCDDLELKSIFNNLADMENAFVDVAYPEIW